MPGIGGRFGWNEPPPAAITTTLQAIVVLSSVRTRKPLFGALQLRHHLAEMELRA